MLLVVVESYLRLSWLYMFWVSCFVIKKDNTKVDKAQTIKILFPVSIVGKGNSEKTICSGEWIWSTWNMNYDGRITKIWKASEKNVLTSENSCAVTKTIKKYCVLAGKTKKKAIIMILYENYYNHGMESLLKWVYSRVSVSKFIHSKKSQWMFFNRFVNNF